ncbi:MAG: NAD-dependent deacylase [Truepera sp.]|nr:NAD-dependent deacylase [Truepera sp.]
MPSGLTEAKAALLAASRVAVLAGAGLSAASGIPTFRGQGGLWRPSETRTLFEGVRPEALATPEAYRRNPELVWAWYRQRFELTAQAEPNPAHYALAELQARVAECSLVTQNVDGLQQRTGARVLELHGNLTHSRCERCGWLDLLTPGFAIPPYCSRCGQRARPNVVWFGELLPQAVWDEAVVAFAQAEVALVVGTSGVVEPAASLARLAKDGGAFLIEINPEATPLSHLADAALRASAVEGLLPLLDRGHAAPNG